MIRYIQPDFQDDDRSSMGTIDMEVPTSSSRYNSRNQLPRRTSKWGSLSIFERALILTAGLLLAATLVFLTLALANADGNTNRIHNVQPNHTIVRDPRPPTFYKNKPNEEEQPEQLDETLTSTTEGPCLNKYCIATASEALNYLDIGEYPREDFYGFTCNQWITENPLPEPEKKSSMNEDEKQEKLSGDLMLDFIREVVAVVFRIDNWPMERTINMLQNRYNMEGYFFWTIGEDSKNSSNHVIQINQTSDDDAKYQDEKITNEVSNVSKNNLRSILRIDAKTRKDTEEKAEATTDMIGFPEFILNSTQLDEKYKDLHLKTNLVKSDNPLRNSGWTVNAYYSSTGIKIVFLAGILQKSFYDVYNPKSLNYGAMGVVIGHELIHAFDTLNKWLDPKSVGKFVEKICGIIKQYIDFQVIGMNINGEHTLRENIPDNGGLKAAFNAYISSKSEKEADYLSLPGLNLTHRKLFFDSFAQVDAWCSAVTFEVANLQIEKDPPPELRVIVPLVN